MKQTFRTILVALMAMFTVTFVGCGTSSDEWVDLGLPSGLLWATCNVGATAPEEYGDYFAWGETLNKSEYEDSNYRYCTSYYEVLSTLTKYNTSEDYGVVDNLTTLESGDDAATVRLGNGARTPTEEEWWELINNTTSEWLTINDVSGCRFTAPNGKSIFLPAAGCYAGPYLYLDGECGKYWSATLGEDESSGAKCLLFDSKNDRDVGLNPRTWGLPVRAVRSAN